MNFRAPWSGSMLCIALSTSLFGCGKRLSEEECVQLLDHYTEKVIEQARPSAKPVQRTRWVGEARLKAAQDPEFARCAEAVRRDQFECALQSHTADEIERCLL